MTEPKYKQTIFSDGDLTIVIQNTFQRPGSKTTGDFSEEIWHVTMVSPYYESGVYCREVAKSQEDAIEMALNQFNEEFGCEYTREELLTRLKRIDF